MSFSSGLRASLAPLRRLVLTLALVIPVAVAAGSASAFFIWALDYVTHLRFAHPWLLWLLPVAGVGIAWIYHRHGAGSDKGNNLIIDEIHQPGGGVPARITPLVLATTLLTHLFGGSAGREGTAVQMGGGIAATFAKLGRVSAEFRPTLLMAGVAAGFGSVFGTPLAGAVFAMEVLTIGRIHYERALPCLLAGLIGDLTCRAWGITHAGASIASLPAEAGITWTLIAKTAAAGAAFGLCARLFVAASHGIAAASARFVPAFWLRPVIGGLLVIGLTHALGTREYLGLGTWSPFPGDTTTLSVFQAGGADTWSWAWKLVFTAITLGCGFKGGEVTPLFFIGGALGNTLAGVLGLPVDLTAGLGFVAVFAGATNTPLACTLMGLELFGAQHTVLFGVACLVAYALSGPAGIYASQRRGAAKI